MGRDPITFAPCSDSLARRDAHHGYLAATRTRPLADHRGVGTPWLSPDRAGAVGLAYADPTHHHRCYYFYRVVCRPRPAALCD